jgi:hypothetical protein
MFDTLFSLFSALLIALLPAFFVLGWLFMPGHRNLYYRLLARMGALHFNASVAVICFAGTIAILVARDALAADAAPALVRTVIDWTPLINKLIELGAGAMAGVILVLLHRGIALLQQIHLFNTNQVHTAHLDQFATDAAGWVAVQLEAIVDPHVRLAMKPSLLAKAAQMVVDRAPLAIDATGLTAAGAKAAIEMKLDPPNPVVVPDAAPAIAA